MMNRALWTAFLGLVLTGIAHAQVAATCPLPQAEQPFSWAVEFSAQSTVCNEGSNRDTQTGYCCQNGRLEWARDYCVDGQWVFWGYVCGGPCFNP